MDGGSTRSGTAQPQSRDTVHRHRTCSCDSWNRSGSGSTAASWHCSTEPHPGAPGLDSSTAPHHPPGRSASHTTHPLTVVRFHPPIRGYSNRWKRISSLLLKILEDGGLAKRLYSDPTCLLCLAKRLYNDPTCLLCLGADISYAKLARAPAYSTVAIFFPILYSTKKAPRRGRRRLS